MIGLESKLAAELYVQRVKQGAQNAALGYSDAKDEGKGSVSAYTLTTWCMPVKKSRIHIHSEFKFEKH